MKYKEITLIAELCCNHMGDIKVAKCMVDTLANFPYEFGPKIIKFQKRTPKDILSLEAYNAPHPNPKFAYAKTYGEHREFLEFSKAQHIELKKYIEDKGLTYASSVFDKQSALDILDLNPKLIKISSANNIDYDLLKYIDNHYMGEIHISLGMTTKEEEEEIFKSIVKNRENLVLYACTSAYPVPVGDSCLLEISRLKDTYGKYIKGIGFSGHHLGTTLDIAAVALGAEYIERHFTLNKDFKGTDHALSLNPDEFFELAKNLHEVSKDLCYKETDILKSEEDVRSRLKLVGQWV